MKFIIISTILFICFSASNAVPTTQKPSPFDEAAANYARDLVKQWEQSIPGWDSKGSVKSNLIALAMNPFETFMIPPWNPHMSAKDNYIRYLGLLDPQDFDINKPIVDNINKIVNKYFNKLPIPLLFPKTEIEKKIADQLSEYIKEHFDVKVFNESLDQGFRDWLGELADVKVSDPKGLINESLDKLFALIPGVNPDSTLEDLALQATQFILGIIDF